MVIYNIKIVFFGGENFNNGEKKFISTLNLSEKKLYTTKW